MDEFFYNLKLREDEAVESGKQTHRVAYVRSRSESDGVYKVFARMRESRASSGTTAADL